MSVSVLNVNSKSIEFDRLCQHFTQTFKEVAPKFIVSVPGRVNLIGEHVDYNGFAVLPMAIDKRISMAIGWRLNSNQNDFKRLKFGDVWLSNVQSDLYETTNCVNPFVEHCASNAPAWYQYFACGYRGVIEKLEQQIETSDRSVIDRCNQIDLFICISGDIPPSSGLSSSSALVCGAAIAIRHAFDTLVNGEQDCNKNNCLLTSSSIDKLEMASDCAKFERFIGTQGGGMDQAIALLAEPGAALLIEFKPRLASFSVSLPNECEFFIAHCGQTLNKAATAHYNRRVLETRAAVVLLRRSLAGQLQDSRSNDHCITLWELMQHYSKSFEEMIECVHRVLSKYDHCSLADLLESLQIESIEQLAELLHLPTNRLRIVLETISSENGNSAGEPGNEFRLYSRALHVFEEANRVYQLKQLSQDSKLSDDQKLTEIGRLMNDSHQSCRRLFECSSDALDRLVARSLESGAYGARLTGAGWGGCIVSLVPKQKSRDYLKQMNCHSQFVFQTSPAQGAIVYNLNK